MKVLQLGTSLYDWGGIERYIVYLAQGLRERGHTVEVAAPPGSPLAQRSPVTVRPLAMRFQYGYWKLPAFLKLFREGRYDVVHVHFSPEFVVPLLAAKMANVPRIVMTRHVALPWSAKKVRRYAGAVHRIVCVSDAVCRALRESGVPGEKLVVAKAGCPPLTPTGNSPAFEGEVKVGFFGRLVADKGVQHLVEASESLPSGVVVHLFGEGPLRAEIEPKKPPARFHGFVPEVADAMAAMDMIVVPSVWAEAFPFAVLEAMSLGKPIVATRRGGLPEMVQDGETGVLVDAESAFALAEAIADLASAPERRVEMGALARQIHQTSYTVEAFAERMEKVYLDLQGPESS